MHIRKETRFRDEIRRIVLLYALWPLLAAAVLVILIVASVWYCNGLNAATNTLSSVNQKISAAVEGYDEKLVDMAGRLDMARFEGEAAYQAALKSDVYRYVNSQEERAAFYLLSSGGELLFTSERDQVQRERMLTHLYWRITRMLDAENGSCVITLFHEAEMNTHAASLLIGRKMKDGYACFALPASAFEESLARLPANVVVTNAFGAIYLENTTVFNAPLGKVDTRIETYRGFVRHDRDFYHVRQGDALHGTLHIYAVKSIGDLIYMVVLMSILVAIMIAVLVVMILLSSRHIAREKIQIIDEIVQAFQKTQRGELNARLKICSNDEFQIIGEAYNSMLDSIRELMERNVLQAQETAVSRVRQLEAQFNPHFLFNTLENVRFMVRLDPKAADAMILSLSRLLRYSIKRDAQTVTLQEDLSYTYNYLSILKHRFGDRLSYQVHVPEELEDCCLPKLIMQPILENAIIYGMEKQEKLHIVVQVSNRGDMLCISVRDDGPGIPAEKYESILEKMNAEHIHVGEHMGILNVHYRLRLIYGANSGLEIHTGAQEGTDVRLILPLMIQKGEELHDAESADRGR